MVIERRRYGFLVVDDMAVTDVIQLAGGNAGLDVGRDHLQDLGGEATGHSHLCYFVGCLDGNGHASTLSRWS